MPIDQTLRRVDDDLAHGRVLPAINRLRGVLRERPERLDVRMRLAAVYRGQGEPAQAGRWSYLAEDPDPADVAAFERQFRTATGRLRALAWSGDVAVLGPQAAARLDALRTAAAAEGEPDSPTQDEGGTLGCVVAAVLFTAVASATLALLVVGGVTVVRWLAG